MFKVKHVRTADCVVAGYRVHKTDDRAIGSLLLGLYDANGDLANIGVVGALPMTQRRALFEELQPLVTTFEEHPWNWAKEELGTRTPRHSEFSRWSAGKDLTFVPLRPERVIEVRYDHFRIDYGSPLDPLSSIERRATLVGRRSPSPKSEANLQVEARAVRYDDPANNDFDALGTYVGGRWDATPKTTLQGRIGLLVQDVSAGTVNRIGCRTGRAAAGSRSTDRVGTTGAARWGRDRRTSSLR